MRLKWALLAFVVSLCVTHILSSSFQSILVMAALENVGAEFPFATRLRVIGHDIVGLIAYGEVSFGVYLAIGMAIALPVAALVRKFLKWPGFVAYPLAGAVCLFAILYGMKLNSLYNMTFLEGTRGAFGWPAQLLAGALGGAVFFLILKRRA